MDFKRENNSITAVENGEELGVITYSPDGENHIIVSHTEVNPQAEGKGIGHHLVEEIVRMAREEGITINPQCPFAARVIEKKPEMQDVVKR